MVPLLCPPKTQRRFPPIPSAHPPFLSLGHRVLLPGDGLSHGPLLPGPGPSTGSRLCPAPQRPPSLPKGQTGASGTSYHADRLVGTNMPPFSAPPPGLCTVCSVLLQVCPWPLHCPVPSSFSYLPVLHSACCYLTRVHFLSVSPLECKFLGAGTRPLCSLHSRRLGPSVAASLSPYGAACFCIPTCVTSVYTSFPARVLRQALWPHFTEEETQGPARLSPGAYLGGTSPFQSLRGAVARAPVNGWPRCCWPGRQRCVTSARSRPLPARPAPPVWGGSPVLAGSVLCVGL